MSRIVFSSFTQGSECEYRHSDGARVNPRDCWYWFNGSCLNSKCSFRHPVSLCLNIFSLHIYICIDLSQNTTSLLINLEIYIEESHRHVGSEPDQLSYAQCQIFLSNLEYLEIKCKSNKNHLRHPSCSRTLETTFSIMNSTYFCYSKL